MSYRTRRPVRMAGAVVTSGSIDTGEVTWTRGGARAATVLSGGITIAVHSGIYPTVTTYSGGHVLFFSGAGRLNTLMPHLQMQSGVPVFFYDAGAIAPSGVSVSGQKVFALIPPTHRLGDVLGFQSGYGFTTPWRDYIECDIPFTSGLCAAIPSGIPGFTLTYTPEALRSGAGNEEAD